MNNEKQRRAQMLKWVCDLSGARSAKRGTTIQTLWSGYGEIVRVELEGAPVQSVIVKRVAPPGAASMRAGARRSHKRKLRSYAVEATWYRDWATRCGEGCRVPKCLGVDERDGGWVFALEDLDAAGFPGRRYRLSPGDTESCLAWLAHFHATFMGAHPRGLFETGTYWHLATRPDELEVMQPGPLRDAAATIDRVLETATHRTLVHGDAKAANFCFGSNGEVAAVDFQYVGGGCGMKDVAYLLSCLGPRECQRNAERHLDGYFACLRAALRDSAVDADAVEAEWRALYPFAWADFERFLAGWAPSHAMTSAYARTMSQLALDQL